jgi:hypothetical protein
MATVKIMAEEISDEKFKSDVMRFIEVATQKFDGLIADVRTNSFKLDRLENKVDSVENRLETLTSEVKVLGGQFRDVGVLAIKDTNCIDVLEKRVDGLESGVH